MRHEVVILQPFSLQDVTLGRHRALKLQVPALKRMIADCQRDRGAGVVLIEESPASMGLIQQLEHEKLVYPIKVRPVGDSRRFQYPLTRFMPPVACVLSRISVLVSTKFDGDKTSSICRTLKFARASCFF